MIKAIGSTVPATLWSDIGFFAFAKTNIFRPLDVYSSTRCSSAEAFGKSREEISPITKVSPPVNVAAR